VSEHDKDNYYVHHDYLLPAFPLCVAWLSYPVGGSAISGNKTQANIAAVGTFEPYIELWDLDIVDQPAPLALLGGPEHPQDLVKGSVKGKKLIPESHTDSVLGLSWNTLQQNLLASASADKTIKLWDLMNGSCIRTYTNSHKNKVQTVLWNPVETPILASGDFDGVCNVIDIRAPPESPSSTLSVNLKSDIECIAWLPAPLHSHVIVSCENGFVYCFDIMKGFSQPLWTLQAHTKSTQAIAANPFIPGLLATGSSDQASPLKLWDISEGQPRILYSKTGDMDNVLSIKWSIDEPFVFGVGTNGTRPVILDCFEFPGVAEKFGAYKKSTTTTTTTTPNLQFTYTPPQPTNTSSTAPLAAKKKKKNKKKK